MATVLENLNLEDGKSDALRNALACISEASAADGGPRYAGRVCRALGRIVVCRSYAKPLMELSHLLVCASARDGQFEDIFWGIDRASVGEFRRSFAGFENVSPYVVIADDGVIHKFSDGAFQVSYGRMPFLAALLEFMIMTLGYQKIDDLTKPLRQVKLDETVVLDVAKTLQRCLYQYLKKHIPPAQRQRRERHFLSYVVEHCGNRSGADAISDDVVLAYWVAFADTDDIEAKTYRGVYETASRLITALDGAQDRLAGSRAAPIGTDFEAGEVDPMDTEAVTALFDEGQSPLTRILESCAEQVKFVNANEADLFSEIPLVTSAGRRLPVSVLRNAVFGAAQLRMTTALRRKTSMENLFPDQSDALYSARLQTYRGVIESTERMALAAFWLLHQERRAEAINLALKLAPDLDWEALLGNADDEHTGNVVSLEKTNAVQNFFATEARVKGHELEALLADAKRAWRSVNRAGFIDPPPSVVDIVEEAVPDVLRLIEGVHRFLERDIHGIDWVYYEGIDQKTFYSVLNSLYNLDMGVPTHAS